MEVVNALPFAIYCPEKLQIKSVGAKFASGREKLESVAEEQDLQGNP